MTIGLNVAIVISIKRRKERDESREALLAEAEEELQTAHKMQMGLMPTVHPQIEGLEVFGRCVPANHVSGDFFQYFEQDGKLSLTMADVTGHAMDAAIPVVMFSGILSKQMEFGGSLDTIFDGLNHSMCQALDDRTFVCFMMGQIDLSNLSFSFSNGGCPYHFQAESGAIVELENGVYPLGVRPDTEYQVTETQLQSGDRIIFCSDGIIEAEDGEGNVFGFEHTAETICQACREGLSAEATIDYILNAVSEFTDDAQQSDDMTCVVLCVA